MDLDDRIECEICGRWFRALTVHLRLRHGTTAAEYRRRFGVRYVTSPATRYIAGLRCVRIGWGKRAWTDSMVIQAIRERAESGLPLNHMTVRAQDNALVETAVRRHASWDAALRAAGIDPAKTRRARPGRHWSPRQIVEAICKRRAQGLTLAWSKLQKEDVSLISAAVSHFGAWRPAIEAAGIDYATVLEHASPVRWTRKEIVSELQRLRAEHADLAPKALALSHNSLYRALFSCFGSYAKAFRAAGLPWREYHHRRRRQGWTRRKIVDRLRRLLEQGESIGKPDLAARDPAMHHAVSRLYRGGWTAAYRAAGLDPRKYLSRPARLSRREILQDLRARIERGESLLYADARREQCRLVSAIEHRFGSWTKGLAAAGVRYQEVVEQSGRPVWSLEKIHAILKQDALDGLPMEKQAVERRHPGLYGAVRKRGLGKWEDVLRAAGAAPMALGARGRGR